MRALLTTVSLLALAVPALAQAPLPALPSGPGASVPRPVQGAPVGSAAPLPAQPQGGFVVGAPVVPGGGDTAGRQSLSGAAEYQSTLQQQSFGQLENLTSGVTPSRPASTAPADTRLDSAPIAGVSELETITRGQKNIVVLKQKVEEAKLATELWRVLFNNEDVKAMREKEEKAAAAAEDKKKKEQEVAAAAAQTTNAGEAMASALRSAKPVAPQVVEVNGGNALLLTPDSGEVWAKAGTRISGGWRVVSVSGKRVTVDGPSGRQTLSFGAVINPPSAPALPGGMAPRGPAMPIGMAPRI